MSSLRPSGEAELVRPKVDVLSVEHVDKSFGATTALADVSFSISAGEVHALLGENGAGKSTVLSIIAGLIRPDRGVLRLDGKAFAPKNALEAREGGIAIVPQEPMLARDLSVRENVTLGREPLLFGLVDRQAARAITKQAMAALGAEIDPDAIVSTLSPAECQIVTIARALAQRSSRVLILDEPTSSLSASDASRVLDAVQKLATTGKTIIYVSHHLAEVKQVAQRFTVMRAGKVVESGAVADASVARLAELMLGRSLEIERRARRAPGEVLLSLDNVAGERLPLGVSLTLRRGEILGIAGLVGAGRSELCRAVFGLDRVRSGKVKIARYDSDGGKRPWQRLAQGVGMLSEDRKGEGLLTAMSIADNITISRLGRVTKLGLVSERAQNDAATSLIARLGIKAESPRQPAASLSGGNQQKVAIARLLFDDVDVFLLDEPTRGIDPGSRESIYRLFEELADEGKAVLWVSSQAAELLRVCDRVATMYRGRLGPVREINEVDEPKLLAEAAGGAA